MKNAKKLITLVLVLALTASVFTPAQGAKAASIQAVNTRSMMAGLTITDGNAKCVGQSTAIYSDSTVKGTLILKKLKKNKFTTIKTWNVSANTYYIYAIKYCTVSKGIYRLVWNSTITRNGKSETISCSDNYTY